MSPEHFDEARDLLYLAQPRSKSSRDTKVWASIAYNLVQRSAVRRYSVILRIDA